MQAPTQKQEAPPSASEGRVAPSAVGWGSSQPYETGFLENTEVLDDAEDVKTVRFEGSRGTADIAVTDESMEMSVETAEEVFKRINVHMGDIRELFDEAREDNDA